MEIKDYTIQLPQTYTCSALQPTVEARKKAAEGLKGIQFKVLGKDGEWLTIRTIVTNDNDFKTMNRRLDKMGMLHR